MIISEQLEQEGWKTPDTYCKHFSEIPKKSGVYIFLKVDLDLLEKTRTDTVLYVGMSRNLLKRVSTHNIKPMIKCDYMQVWFKEELPPKIRDAEKKLIQRFNPPFNISGKMRGLNV
jgi:excinuclease UvrABC nuclease subunit